MAHAIQEVLAVLDRGAQARELRQQDVGFVAQVLDDLPALAWGEIPTRDREAGGTSEEHPNDPPAPRPVAVLIVGGETLAEALGGDGGTTGRAFECERTDEFDKALEVARTHAPDLVLIDTDMPGAPELVEALLADPLTDPMPIVVLGTFGSPEEVARFTALGVVRALTKPISAELLRATCDEIVDTRDERTIRMTLGEPTLEQLANRLSDEMRSALVDSVDRMARSHRVPLGEGTEVLAALWGAIARVQEIVSQKTGGAIRFGGQAPEGAIALAPWLHQDLPAAERIAGRGRSAAADVRLNGRIVVVADDDPGVTWFISDLLRTAGCVVHEALDGTTALDLAFRVQPELVVSDILMPGIDGFALCRALRRDVALRDTPVILLSWKEDLLQRVRELGASAAAYLRKESGSRAILARVREVLRPRARIELRLHGDGEVRGRLDGLTPRLLLELVCLVRKSARVAIRDAADLFEVEVRAGAPRKATRTASDGSYQSGERALASLLGVGAGRFVVTPSTEPIHGELTGTLFEQLVRPIALARGALAATAGARTTAVERLVFDPQALESYLSATPEPTRTLIHRLALGATPRQMLLAGEVSPSLLEDVLSDLAARGAIQGVEGANGADVLTPAVNAALAVLRGAVEPRRSLPPNTPPNDSWSYMERAPRYDENPAHLGLSSVPPASTGGTLAPSEPAPASPDEVDAVPSSLEDAVMREISGRSFEPRTSRTPTSDPPPIVEPSELRPRTSNPPESGAFADGGDEPPVVASIPPASIPPDAVVPATMTSEEFTAASAQRESRPADPASADVPGPARDTRARSSPPESAAHSPLPSLPRRGPGRLLLALGAAAAVVAATLFWPRLGGVSPLSAPDAPAVAIAPPTAPASAASAAHPPSPPASADDDLPPGAEVPPGFGLLEVRAPTGAVVRIDGAVSGSGPFVTNVMAPGYHEVRIEQAGRESAHVIEVRRGKTTRVGSPSPP
jgi:CheY-like chemotaxis protein